MGRLFAMGESYLYKRSKILVNELECCDISYTKVYYYYAPDFAEISVGYANAPIRLSNLSVSATRSSSKD